VILGHAICEFQILWAKKAGKQLQGYFLGAADRVGTRLDRCLGEGTQTRPTVGVMAHESRSIAHVEGFKA